MLDKVAPRNVVEVDALIEKARERLAHYEHHAARNTHAEGAHEVVDRMRKGLANLWVYRSFLEKMN